MEEKKQGKQADIKDTNAIKNNIADGSANELKNSDIEDMPAIKNKNTKKKKGCGFNFKQRLFLTLFVSIAVSITLYVFGPISIYGSNIEEFNFVLGDYIIWNIVLSVLSVGLCCAILLPLRGLAFDIAFSILFYFTLGFFIQGNYLNGSLHSLGADDGGVKGGSVIINSIIWAILGGGVITALMLLKKKHRDIIKIITTISMVTIIGVQCVSTVVLAINNNIFVSHDARVQENIESGRTLLNYDNMGKVSKHKNVVYFVVDKFDWNYYVEASKTRPEMFDELDGFTLYDDALSLYPRTYPSVVYMITGQTKDWNESRLDFFNSAYKNSEFLKTLSNNNYNINLYTDIYYAYEDANCMGDYVVNKQAVKDYHVIDKFKLATDMSYISYFRYAPFWLKKFIYIDSGSFAKRIRYDGIDLYTLDMKEVYTHLMAQEFSKYEDDKNNFSFIHFTGAHTPYLYDDDFNPAVLNVSVVSALNQSFKIINRYICELKRLGVYDDTTIIITGDHGNIKLNTVLPDSPRTIPIFFKASGSTGEGYKVDHAPVAHANIHASILDSVGIDRTGIHLPSDKSMQQLHEGDDVTREYRFQRQEFVAGEKIFEEVFFEIKGSAKNFDNWKVLEEKRKFYKKDLYV